MFKKKSVIILARKPTTTELTILLKPVLFEYFIVVGKNDIKTLFG